MSLRSMLGRRVYSTLFMGVLVTVVGGWAAHWLGPAPAPDPIPRPAPEPVAKSSPPTIARLLSDSPVSLARWQFDAEDRMRSAADRARLFGEHLGRQVVWEGFFDSFHPVREGATANNRYTLIMYDTQRSLNSEQVLGPPFVRCWLPAEAGPQLEQLKRGQWIVVRGTLADPRLLGSLLCTDLRVCKVLAAGDQRNVQMAAAPTATQAGRR
jgi:hypothetical protein